jgi:hypothetical protein
MIRLLGWVDETTRAAEPGFVPRLESLEHRVVLSEGKKVKIDFAAIDPVQVWTVPAQAVGLVAPPADPADTGGPVQVAGGVLGFESVYVDVEPALFISTTKGN